MQLPASKTKVLAFKYEKPVLSKQLLIIEFWKKSATLVFEVPCNSCLDPDVKLNKFRLLFGGNSQKLFKTQNKQRNSTKLYKTIAVPTFIYGSEAWIFETREESKIPLQEYSFKDLWLEELDGTDSEMKMFAVDLIYRYFYSTKIDGHRNQCDYHLKSMSEYRIPGQPLHIPEGWKRRGKPRKR